LEWTAERRNGACIFDDGDGMSYDRFEEEPLRLWASWSGFAKIRLQCFLGLFSSDHRGEWIDSSLSNQSNLLSKLNFSSFGVAAANTVTCLPPSRQIAWLRNLQLAILGTNFRSPIFVHPPAEKAPHILHFAIQASFF
jgi:hypothetical protein